LVLNKIVLVRNERLTHRALGKKQDFSIIFFVINGRGYIQMIEVSNTKIVRL
jgi:hypothetical protein